MAASTIDLIGVGSPIVDALARVDEGFLGTIGGEKGGMVLVEADTIAGMLARLPEHPQEAAGGSAGNTTFTAARLGLKTAFLGKLGNDVSGRFFAESFRKLGGDDSRFLHGEVANARCLSLITPDSARTLRTCLGAAATLEPEEITEAAFRGCRHAHIEGYLLFNEALMRAVLEAAKAAGCTISLDLGSFEVVRAAGNQLEGLLREYVDVLFANEDEAAAMPGNEGDFADMARRITGFCQIAVVKLGPVGSIIAEAGGDLHRIRAVPAEKVIDTTGAGDAWAAGFLYGWLNDQDLPTCGQLGSILGAEVVQSVGASISPDRWPATRLALHRLAAVAP